MTELRVIIAKVGYWATLPPGPRLWSRIAQKVTKSDGIMVKVEHLLDGFGQASIAESWCRARDRSSRCRIY